MPLSEQPAPCAFCLREAADAVNEETQEPIGIANVLLTEITPTVRTCVKCIRHFCRNHASPVDQSDCCYECLPHDAITEMKTPLVAVDEEGNHILQKGYRLVPTGAGYKTLPQAIASMTDAELEAYITEKSNQIHFVERQRDYLRIAHSTAKLEQGERADAVNRALRGVKVPGMFKQPSAGIKITGKANGTLKGVDMPGGLSLTDFLKFAGPALAKMRAAKASQSGKAPGAVVSGSSVPVAPQAVHQQPSGAAKPPEGGGVPGVTPPPQVNQIPGASTEQVGAGRGKSDRPLTPDEVKEKAREAEIEAILDGGDVISEGVK